MNNQKDKKEGYWDKQVSKCLTTSIMANFIYLSKWNLGLGFQGYVLVFIIMYLLWISVKLLYALTQPQTQESMQNTMELREIMPPDIFKLFMQGIFLIVIPIGILLSVNFWIGIGWLKLLTFYIG